MKLYTYALLFIPNIPTRKLKKKTTSIGPYKYSQNEDERLLARFKK